MIFVLYQVYTFVRNTFGSNGNSISNRVNPEAVATALGHAHDVIDLEKRLGLFFEPALQQWYLDLPGHGLIRMWNIYYGSFHFIVPMLLLIWLFVRHPQHYSFWRNALAVTTVLGLIGFASFSLMPPRLLSVTSTYGGCTLPSHLVAADPRLACQDFGIVDTLAVYGGLWNFGSDAMANISNQYAAMPSLHIAWSTWAALVVIPLVHKRRYKIVAALYPISTCFCILITGNHYWLDALGGLVTLAVGTALGFALARLWNGFLDRRDQSRPTVDTIDAPGTPGAIGAAATETTGPAEP